MCGPTSSTDTSFRASPTDLGFDTVSLSDKVHVLLARSTYWPAPGNVVVIADADGLTLIDCGFGSEEAFDELTATLGSMGYSIDAVHTALVTHPHPDHAAGIPLLPEHARVLGPGGLGPIVGDVVATAELIFPSAVRALAPERAELDIVEHMRVDCGVVDRPVRASPLRPGEEVTLGNTRWLAVLTPGHEDGMFSYVEPDLGVVVCSDVVSSPGTAIPWYAPGGGGTSAYLNGLERLNGFDLKVGIRGHGGLINGSSAMVEAIGRTASSIEQRVDKIWRTLHDRPQSFAELERTIYPERIYDVIPWAASVLATHLLEGIEDGSIRQVDDGFAAGPRTASRS